MKKILFLAAWYPHRYDAMAGLFVRKHALAVSRFANVCVLFPYADENISDFEIVTQKTENVLEIYVYFPVAKNRFFRFFSKPVNFIRAFYNGYCEVIRIFGKPSLTHVHVLTRVGLVSFFLKRKENIPYVITEQWSRYFPERNSFTGFWHRKITQFVVKNAAFILPVSSKLEFAMKQCGLRHPKYCNVGNVVDDFFFLPQEKEGRTKKRILHVSCFDENAKNLGGILRVMQRLSDERFDFELIVVGTGPDYGKIYREAKKLELLDEYVFFVGEQTPEQVSEWMHQSDFFLLFSNYETFATVIPESLASGIPVVTSNVGIAPDIINEKNGRIVPVGDESALFEQVNWMLDNYSYFNAEIIRESAEQFSFDAVGKNLLDIYEQI